MLIKFKWVLIFLWGLLQLCISAQNRITGIWELVYVAPTNMEETEPRGISNIRLFFTPDGELYSIFPDQTFSDSIPSVKYEFNGNTLSVLPGGGDSVILNVTFRDSSTMVFNPEIAARRIFKRIYDPDNLNKTIELKSLQLVNTGEMLTDTGGLKYDDSDYSSMPLKERIIGVWETIEYTDVPNGEMPPYGFPNDIWIIKIKELINIHRASKDTSIVKYQLTDSSEIILNADDQNVAMWKVYFNQWGHLVFDGGNGAMLLKLVSRDTENIPNIPLKIVLLKMAGEE